MDFIFGIRPLIEAIQAGKEIEKVLLQKGLSGENYKEVLILIQEHGIPFQYVPYQKLNRLCKKNHQGVITFLSVVEYQDIANVLPMIYEKAEDPFLLILDRISDVRNIGAIIRTAECAGVHAIIIPEKGSAQINADAVKTSAGAVHRLPICRSKSLYKDLKLIKDSGIKVLACTEKADKEYTVINYTFPLAIILGSEEDGISSDLLKMADAKAKIPLKGEILSLNVSVAAGIILYEALKHK
jgi:23S rRNA (guanosine2251-2'-O)-methyltransferase